jgi:hypothetical protein
LQIKAVWSYRSWSRLNPENSQRPLGLLRQSIRAGKAPISFQGTGTEFGGGKVGFEQSLIGLIHLARPEYPTLIERIRRILKEENGNG